jgi:hypothetical protein
MSDYTTTPNLGLYKPTYDSDEEQWGGHLNSNADVIDGVLATDGTGQFLPLAGGAMQGTLTLFTNPVDALDAVSKQYLDNQLGTMLPIAGGTMTGPLTLFSDPSSALQPVTLQYYNAHLPAPPDLSGYAPIASPNFTGNPTAPTPAPGDNDTTLATTAFVAAALGGVPGGAVIADTAPTALPGALWWDSVGCQLYVRYDDGNSTAWINATNAGLGTIQVSDSAPSNAAQNSLWFCSTDLMLYVRYYDGNSTQWVPAVNLPASVGEAPVDTSVYGRSGQAWTKVTPLTAGNVGRNVLHNSQFNIAQRGTGPWTANNYTVDRWTIYINIDTATVQRYSLTDSERTAIGDEAATFAISCNVTGSATAGAVTVFYQRVEGIKRLSGKTVIVSFWVSATSGPKNIGVSIDQNYGTGGSPSAGTTTGTTVISVAGPWARYSVAFAVPSATGKTLGTNGDDNQSINFIFSQPSSAVGRQTSTFTLYGVQCEIAQPGQTQPTSLEKLDPVTQLQQCQRFYQKFPTFNVGGVTAVGVSIINPLLFPVPMRATPTFVGGMSGGLGYTSPSLAAIGPFGVNVTATGNATNYIANVDIAASADL